MRTIQLLNSAHACFGPATSYKKRISIWTITSMRLDHSQANVFCNTCPEDCNLPILQDPALDHQVYWRHREPVLLPACLLHWQRSQPAILPADMLMNDIFRQILICLPAPIQQSYFQDLHLYSLEVLLVILWSHGQRVQPGPCCRSHLWHLLRPQIPHSQNLYVALEHSAHRFYCKRSVCLC